MDKRESILLFREWSFLLSTLSVIALLITVATIRRYNSDIPHIEYVTVRVIGAVLHDQSILLPANATMGDLLSRVELSEAVAVEKIAFDAPLKPSQAIIIPSKAFVTVLIKDGQGNEQLLLTKEGSTFRDLEQQFSFGFGKRKRRALKEGEIIEVAQKIERR